MAQMNSTIGSAVSNRQRLSAIRQRVGLEHQGTQMRELAPLPPTGPAEGTSPQREALRQRPQPQPPPQAQPSSGVDINRMREAAAFFIQNFRPSLVARNQQPAQTAQPPPPPAAPGAQQPTASMGSAPPPPPPAPPPPGANLTPAQRRVIAERKADLELTRRLGRPPTPTERELFLSAPPSGARRSR